MVAVVGVITAILVSFAMLLPQCDSGDAPVKRYCSGLTLSSCHSTDGAKCTASTVRVQKTSWGWVSQMTCTHWSLSNSIYPYHQPRPLVTSPPIEWDA